MKGALPWLSGATKMGGGGGGGINSAKSQERAPKERGHALLNASKPITRSKAEKKSGSDIV